VKYCRLPERRAELPGDAFGYRPYNVLPALEMLVRRGVADAAQRRELAHRKTSVALPGQQLQAFRHKLLLEAAVVVLLIRPARLL